MFSIADESFRVLLIDDDVSQIKLLHQTLKQIGELFFEQNSLCSLDTTINVKPDIILLDLIMPNLCGYDVLLQLKQNKSTATIPVIVITSSHDRDDQLDCLHAGAVDFIVKPLHPSIVLARVMTHLRLCQRERQLTRLAHHARVTLDSIGDAVITTDKDGNISYMNPTAELLTGVTSDDAIKQQIEDVMPLKIGDDGPSHINPIRIAIAENRKVGMALNCKMKTQSGRWISVEDSAAPLSSEDGHISGAVIVFKDINESRQMAMQMSHALQYDQLTNLPNRFLLVEYLKTELHESNRKRKSVGLILIDINRFKLINEEFGFEFGDELLRKVSQKIQQQLLNGEKLSRHNADEFMVLAPNISQPGELSSLAILIKESIMQFAKLHAEINNFSISMGLSIYPEDANDSQSLMLHADAALHKAKKEPIHDGVCFYSEEMDYQFSSRRHIYTQIKNAISQYRVVTLYQPIIDAKTRKVESVEALMRIKDDNGALVSPIHFIGLAEETRLIIQLGEQMILQVLEQICLWQTVGTSFRVCINISPIQFIDPHFIPFLLSAIEKYQLTPNVLELEVTEGLMLEDSQQVKQDMVHLRELGMTISIDDFGTGYSCLSYLKNLPVDVLKIDRSFVSQISTSNAEESLVSTITTLAKSMKLNTVAEGVETVDQAQRLQALGVTWLQGYLFSRPVSADEIKMEYL
ncbi:two-component system response regulator [Shewanella indica]|uniref:two-component system response regulator n=1 Tax=Shewanella indica TaxID=768528 RepID=UPI001CFD2239|nr:EAL domain-containing protein [Shewanella indica]